MRYAAPIGLLATDVLTEVKTLSKSATSSFCGRIVPWTFYAPEPASVNRNVLTSWSSQSWSELWTSQPKRNQTPRLESSGELCRPRVYSFSAKLAPTSADRGVSRSQRGGSPTALIPVTRPEPLLFYQVAPQLYPRGWVDPVPDPLLLRKSGSTGNRTRTSGSVARNSDH
jgi:hypothetical protein